MLGSASGQRRPLAPREAAPRGLRSAAAPPAGDSPESSREGRAAGILISFLDEPPPCSSILLHMYQKEITWVEGNCVKIQIKIKVEMFPLSGSSTRILFMTRFGLSGSRHPRTAGAAPTPRASVAGCRATQTRVGNRIGGPLGLRISTRSRLPAGRKGFLLTGGIILRSALSRATP